MDVIDKWFSDRWGKFTASEDYKLLAGGTAGKTFGQGANTYIEQKAMEMCTMMWEHPELEEVKSLLHGKMYEWPAYQAYVKETKNYSITYMGSENPVFLDYEPLVGEAGGTPDLGNITSDFKIDLGGEIKCPKNPIEHFRRLEWKDQWDIKENYPLCYTQMQKLMMCSGAQLWHFISYDERMVSKSRKIKIIEVKPDIKFQDNLDLRLRLAIKEKYTLLAKRMQADFTDRESFLQYKNSIIL